MKPWEQEHDEDPAQEGGMATSNLKRSIKMAEELLEFIDPQGPLPGWVQAKLTTAFNDLQDVHGYIVGQADHGEGVQEEGKKKKPGLWANIHARRKAGKRPHRPGEKGYPKTLDIDEDHEIVKEAIQTMINRHQKI